MKEIKHLILLLLKAFELAELADDGETEPDKDMLVDAFTEETATGYILCIAHIVTIMDGKTKLTQSEKESYFAVMINIRNAWDKIKDEFEEEMKEEDGTE